MFVLPIYFLKNHKCKCKLIKSEHSILAKQKGTASNGSQVPVFVRNKISSDEKSTPDNYSTGSYNLSATNGINEDCDIMLVVDWKNMSAVKLSSISELQIHDIIQFKVNINYEIIFTEVKFHL